MPVQTTYLSRIPPAYEGMIADSRDHDIVSRQIESANVGFGKPVARGAADEGVVFPPGAAPFVGITEASHQTIQDVVQGGTRDTYGQGENVPVMRRGPMWLMASVAVAGGDPLYYVNATGVWTNVAAAGNTLVANARWETSTTGPGLARASIG